MTITRVRWIFCFSEHFDRLQTKLREGDVFTHVSHSVHGGGVSVSGPMFLLRGLCLWYHVPSGGSFSRGGLPDKRPPLHLWTETPPGQKPPYGKERAARILLECILV